MFVALSLLLRAWVAAGLPGALAHVLVPHAKGRVGMSLVAEASQDGFVHMAGYR